MDTTKYTPDFWIAAFYRAIRTGAQTLLSLLAVGMGVFDVDWMQLISVTLMAMIVSLLTSLVTGLPESKIDGTIDGSQFDEVDGFNDGDIVRFKIDKGGK